MSYFSRKSSFKAQHFKHSHIDYCVPLLRILGFGGGGTGYFLPGYLSGGELELIPLFAFIRLVSA
jgi:hypothetical protein